MTTYLLLLSVYFFNCNPKPRSSKQWNFSWYANKYTSLIKDGRAMPKTEEVAAHKRSGKVMNWSILNWLNSVCIQLSWHTNNNWKGLAFTLTMKVVRIWKQHLPSKQILSQRKQLWALAYPWGTFSCAYLFRPGQADMRCSATSWEVVYLMLPQFLWEGCITILNASMQWHTPCMIFLKKALLKKQLRSHIFYEEASPDFKCQLI